MPVVQASFSPWLPAWPRSVRQRATAQTRSAPRAPRASPTARSHGWCRRPIRTSQRTRCCFAPPGDGPFPLAVIAHASTQNVLRRAQMPQPEYAALSAWLVARGFAVLVPERPGHGATGGKYLEDQGGCDDANYSRAGYATAEFDQGGARLSARATFHPAGRRGRHRPLRRRLGRAGAGRRDPKSIAAIIVFAPGRGGHANDFPNQVCAPHTLIAAAAEFGDGARVPVIWLVAANDSYFPPELSRQLADAFRARRRQGGFPHAAGVSRRGPLAGGDRRRRQDLRRRSWSAR